jgi:hypothetical protein
MFLNKRGAILIEIIASRFVSLPSARVSKTTETSL